MTKNYHSSVRISSTKLLVVAVISLAGVAAVELFQTNSRVTHRTEKIAAASLAEQAMTAVKKERLARGIPIDPATDPTQSGLIGAAMTPVTSNTGVLPAKQTTVNPNFAAVVVDMLQQAGVKNGDTVAVAYSGSFPVLNICVGAAMQTLNLKPIIISSASASQWGANHPDLLWIDMEKALHVRRILRFRSVAASLGGLEDRAMGMSDKGRHLLEQAIKRNKLSTLDAQDLADSVNRRLLLYRKQAGDAPIAAFINVGGGTASLGGHEIEDAFEPGLNLAAPSSLPANHPTGSVMASFSREGVPTIHLGHILKLANRYGLPIQPAEMPNVGEGEVYSPRGYNRWLAGGLLLVIVASLYGVSRPVRVTRVATVKPKEAQHETYALTS